MEGYAVADAGGFTASRACFETFLQVPAARLLRALRDWRILSAVMFVNFVIVPLVVAAMITFRPTDQAVRRGVLLVLLYPCVDYVIVFSGLAGASNHRLLAATPLLLLVQMLLLPVSLLLFLGSGLADVVQVKPFVEAFIGLIDPGQPAFPAAARCPRGALPGGPLHDHPDGNRNPATVSRPRVRGAPASPGCGACRDVNDGSFHIGAGGVVSM